MAKKKALKESEARLLLYISQVNIPMNTIDIISIKLDIDYGYCRRLLKAMRFKNWIISEKYSRKTYYRTTKLAPLDKARARLSSDKIQDISNAASEQTKLGEQDEQT